MAGYNVQVKQKYVQEEYPTSSTQYSTTRLIGFDYARKGLTMLEFNWYRSSQDFDYSQLTIFYTFNYGRWQKTKE